MRDDVRRDLSDSASDFLNIVWPVIKGRIGGGELIPVESTTDTGMKRDLDVLAGIDAWHIDRGVGQMRGIASRIQWDDYAWNTFTVRKHRTSGATTEYEKRLYALNNPNKHYLIPALTVHAYITKRPNGKLLSVAVIPTEDLFGYLIVHGRERRNTNDGNIFIYAKWDDLKEARLPIVIIDNQQRTSASTSTSVSPAVRPNALTSNRIALAQQIFEIEPAREQRLRDAAKNLQPKRGDRL